MPLDPAVAAVRSAVRRDLAGATRPVVVACSGGADSLALLAGTVFEAGKVAVPVVGVTVDHGLQEGSAEQAAHVVEQMATLGADETMTVRVHVEARGRGPEAAAREARYAVLEEVAERTGAAPVLLGHTLDDQAETVLLGLARGSGGRSIAGMRRAFPPFSRPLLVLTRAQTEQACRAQGITWWDDPHNDDPRFARSRVRRRVLPVLEEELGPGVALALARTADGLREDVAALDAWAAAVHQAACHDDGLDTGPLDGLPDAVLHRVVRLEVLARGALDADLTRGHVLAVARLARETRTDREIQLPGHLTARREGPLLRLRPTAVRG